MNDPLEFVEQLAAQARRHTPPPLSVAGEVVRRLRAPERSPLLWMTLCAVAATVLLLAMAGIPQYGLDSLDAVFQAAAFIQPDGGW